MSFDHTHYVADVRWKQAEKEALQWLGNEDKSRLMPLIELIPRSFRSNGGETLPVRDAVHGIASEIDSYWGSSATFVDLEHVVSAGIRGADNDPHILEILAEETRRLLPLLPGESTIIPVTGLSRAEDYQGAVASISEEDKTGACLRVTLGDVFDMGFSTKLEAVLSRLKLDVLDADLIVDLQRPNKSSPNLQTLCAELPQLSKWRSFTVLSGAFPKDLQGMEKDSVHDLPRDEWSYWQEQVQLLPRAIRWPTFGDYTVQHAIFEEPKEDCNPSASIRYTYDDYWVILRGHGLKHEGSLGNIQYPAEAQLLCDMDEFCGAEFSGGDRYAYETSQTPDKPGTPFTWLRAGINHHMVYAMRQIAAFLDTGAKARSRRTRGGAARSATVGRHGLQASRATRG